MNQEENQVEEVSEQTEQAPEAEVAAEEAAPEAVEAAPESVEAAPEQEAAPEPEPEAAQAAPEEVDEREVFDRLADALGELPDSPNGRILDGLTEKQIEKLPVEAKVMLKHVLSERVREMERNKAAKSAMETEFQKRKEMLAGEAKSLIQNRAKLAKVFQTEQMKKVLASKDIKDSDLPDPYTPEGIQARVERASAQHFAKFVEPITQSARRAEAESAYNNFIETHPKMSNKKFKSEVATLIKQRREASTPVSLQDAHDLVEHQWNLRDAARKREQERSRRAASARKVGRSSVGSDPANGSDIPDWVAKNGYKGHRGPAATYHFLKDNPKIHARVKKKQGRM
jgi:ribosomal protein S20